MSTIVVVKKAGQAVIATDQSSTYGSRIVPARHLNGRSKIHKCGSSYIGVVGSSAHSNVLASIIERHAQKIALGSAREIFETYRRLHPILKEEYYVNVSEGEDDVYESSQIDGLIANPSGIYGIYSWREVFEYERFWSIGSGSSYALGAMCAAYDRVDDPREIAALGIEAACEFDNSSGLPLTSHTVKLAKAKTRR